MDLGGVYISPITEGGGAYGCSPKWGGCIGLQAKLGWVGIWWPKATDFVHPPPQDDFDSFPKVMQVTLKKKRKKNYFS